MSLHVARRRVQPTRFLEGVHEPVARIFSSTFFCKRAMDSSIISEKKKYQEGKRDAHQWEGRGYRVKIPVYNPRYNLKDSSPPLPGLYMLFRE